MSDIRLDIRSETDLLKQVVIHTPSVEMEMVSPSNRENLLFEDILFLRHARTEHELMCRVFEKVVGENGRILQISELLRESFQHREARDEFVDELCRIAPDQNLQAFESELKDLEAETLLRFALTGDSPLPIHAQPLPNLMFMRDLAAVVGDHLVLSHTATAARARESLIIHVVAHHHPAFADYRDRLITLPQGVTFEGGDLLVVSDDTVIIGNSERTSFGGIMCVARHLLDRTPIESVIMVNLPKQRSCMHLDTVFTFASPDECVIFPPLIELSGLNNVVRLTSGDGPNGFHCQVYDNLRIALEERLGHSVTFARCGGPDLLSQEREQWTDGANFFALAPGVIIGYERNSKTFDEMAQLGYRVVSAEGFLSYYEESDYDPGEKIAIKLDGYELSRGRGGPRCMTMPIARVQS